MIYDPLLAAKPSSVSADEIADTLVSDGASSQVLASDGRDQVVVDERTQVAITHEVTQVIAADDDTSVTVQEEATTLLVDTEQVTVVSVSEIGPPGPAGPPGPPGNAYTAVAPIEVDLQDLTIQLAPGTVNGHGMLWNGSAWVNQVVVPSGAAGTVPYKDGSGYAGDDVNFRYDPSQQALRVTKLDTALVDGGNF